MATGTQTIQQATETQYQEYSFLDSIIEAGVREPARVSLLDQVEAPTQKYSRGRVIVVRDVEVCRQDSDVLSVGGLFGMVEENATAQGHHRMMQAGLFPDATPERGRSGICVCGEEGCRIGPFLGS